MNNPHDKEYLSALQDILENGDERTDRTGVGTLGVFGIRQSYDLQQGFPALTTKKLAWKAVVSELLWFIEGSDDERRLREILHGDRYSDKTTIWTANSEADYWKDKSKFPGDLGRIYGVNWRSWRQYINAGNKDPNVYVVHEIDQLQNLIDGIRTDPTGRRHMLTAWNVGELDQMALPPCHCFAQFYVRENKFLDCQMYQRSNDFFLGGPFNIASYSLFTHMIAQVCGYQPGKLVHVTGDAHIYKTHIEQAKEQLSRQPFAAPTLKLNPDIKDINHFTMKDIELIDYVSHGAIKAPMAV
jgi:thymidylate synthase